MADLRSLTVLAAVVRHRSFTQAARELHVAQQAVSRTVARLEAELGVSLVERTTHRVEPTAAGAALAEDAESLVAAADAAVARARELGGAPPQTLALGMSPGISQGEVERILDAVGAALPGRAARPRRVPPRAPSARSCATGSPTSCSPATRSRGRAATCCRWARRRAGWRSRAAIASRAGARP